MCVVGYKDQTCGRFVYGK